MVIAARGALLGLALLVACQGQGRDSRSGTGSAGVSAAQPRPADAAPASDEPAAPEPPGDARAQPDEPEVVDPSRVIAELGAMPAWQAVVDRAQLLGRRNQHGVVYGRVGPPVMVPAPVVPPPAPGAGSAGSAASAAGSAASAAGSAARGAGSAASAAGSAARGAGSAASATGSAAALGAGKGSAAPARGAPVAAAPAAPARLVASSYVWLIDDTDGNGSLGIRIALGDRAKEGDRIAAGGAWQLDAERRWFWKPDTVQVLPAATPGDLKEPEPPEPSHAITASSAPAGARMISLARDGDAVYFQIVGPAPLADGDGWQVADQLGSPLVAVMSLPGERASYGGQDMRTPDEHWQLKRGQTYWVRIGKLRKHTDKPTTVNARTAPVRVP
jgi:hypothetical protein